MIGLDHNGIPILVKEYAAMSAWGPPETIAALASDVVRKASGRVSHFTQIKNYPVQSFATADIVPIALIHVDDLLSGMQSCIVNSVHDSIIIDIHPDEEEKVISIINQTNEVLSELITLRWGIKFNVPLLLESKIGPNWLDTKDVA